MRWLVVCLALALAAPAAMAEEASAARTLTVTGVGEVAAEPDMARVTLGVTETAPSARDAMDAASAAAGAILSELEAAGIAARDMQTSDLTLSPIWSTPDDDADTPAKIVGFEASNTLTVRVRDLDRLGGVLDAVLEAGANRFRGLSFGLQEPEPVADEARRRAVADAVRKAELYAEGAGVTLAEVMEIRESGSARPEPVMEMAMARAAPVPVAGGEVTTRAQVTMIYRLGD